MAEFTSETKTIPYSGADVFSVLSDLSKLDLVKDKLPENLTKDFSYDQNSCSVNVPPIGTVRFIIVDRQPNSLIKFETEQLPFKLNLFINLEEREDLETQMQLSVKADLNPFLKPMISKPLQEGLDKMANTLAALPFRELNGGSKPE